MANFNYGNSFNSYEGENVGVERISVWKSVREFFPGGAAIAAKDYRTQLHLGSALGSGYEDEPGTLIPAGTPIWTSIPGGVPHFDNLQGNVIGLTYEDVVLGTDGATFTIVTQGEFLESRKQGPEISSQVKKELFGRISFIKEV